MSTFTVCPSPGEALYGIAQVDIKDGAVKAKEDLLGLPAGDAFTTQSLLNHNRMLKRKHHWAWMDHAPETIQTTGAYQPLSTSERQDSVTAWAAQAVRSWQDQGVKIPDEVLTGLRLLESQTSDEYASLNDPSSMEEHLQNHGLYIGTDSLQQEAPSTFVSIRDIRHDPHVRPTRFDNACN